MQTYIVKRLLLFIPTLLLVTLLVFLLMRVVPGDPALYMLVGDNVSGQVTQAQIDAKRAELGTDRPIMVQYGDWIWGMARGNFGISMFFDDPISDTLAVRFPVTLELTAMAQLIAMLVAVPLGVFSAVKQDALGDYAARIVTMTGVAIPTFYTAILTIYFLVLLFEWAPPLNYAQPWEDPWLNLQQLVFPALALGFYNMAITARMTRSAMLEGVSGGLYPHGQVQGPPGRTGYHAPCPQERLLTCANRFRVAARAADGRRGTHRGDLSGPWNGQDFGRLHRTPGLHHDSGLNHGGSGYDHVDESSG